MHALCPTRCLTLAASQPGFAAGETPETKRRQLWARGELSPLSDVNIAVLLQSLDRHDEAEIGSMYSPQVDVVLFHRLPLHIQFEVLKTGKELLVRDEAVYAQIRYTVLRDYLEMSHFYRAMVAKVLR